MKNMKQIIIRGIVQGAIAAYVIMALLVYFSQYHFSKASLLETAQLRLVDAESRLAESETQTESLKNTLSDEYLVKARAFSEMIALDPTIIDTPESLEQVRALLNVDELHVTDEAGVIQWSTIADYIGFDFSSSDQAGPFMQILADNSYELAQDPQPNGAEGKMFQYIGVSRYDKPGIVQIGMEPVRLTEALKDNQPDVILGELTVGSNGTIFAISKSDTTLAAFHDPEYVGVRADEAGIDLELLGSAENKLVYTKIQGERYLVCIKSSGDYYLGALIPLSDATDQTLSVTLVTMLLTMLIIGVVAFFVLITVNKNIIQSMNMVEENMKKITSGDNSVRIDVRTTKEFDSLSNGINGMLDSIESQMQETQRLNRSMESLLHDVYNASQSINSHSAAMKEVSRRLSDGSSSQAATVEELSAAFSSISKDANDNAAAAEKASEFSRLTGEQLKTSAQKMEQMKEAMDKITDYSGRIEKIVNTIDDIAFQTNILALNAAVEAARAGEHGKGFAVVADEVRNLANKSAEAANSTTELISETINAVNNGNVIANEAAEELRGMMEGIEQSNRLIMEISKASAKQAKSVDEAANGMSQISQVAQNNSGISSSAGETADMLDSEASKLITMVTSKDSKK